jgi:hypothetical protein
MIADLHQQLEDGTLFENAIPVAEDDPEFLKAIENKSTRQ